MYIFFLLLLATMYFVKIINQYKQFNFKMS